MQVVNHIRSLIENGTLQPGDKIRRNASWRVPSKSAAPACAPASVISAAMGVMKVRHGVGTFVADGPQSLARDL